MRHAAVLQWNDLFVIVDDGTLDIGEYRRLEGLVRIQSTKFSQGLGCLVILPPGAKPPPDEVRRYINDMLGRFGTALRCLAYAVEGTGFRAATTRATLIGMKVFQKKAYPLHVDDNVEDALTWILSQLARGKARVTDVPTAARAIAQARSHELTQ